MRAAICDDRAEDARLVAQYVRAWAESRGGRAALEIFPSAEAEIYEKLNDMVGDKTAIYISHRLSSCKFCDEIVVFDAGRLVQQGAHAALLSDADGEYARLWNAQAQYYR